MTDNEIIKFIVIDNKTGKEPNSEKIALKEEWAKHLIYCDMEGFAIGEDGTLMLLDECGGVAYCPEDRFTVIYEETDAIKRAKAEAVKEFAERLKEEMDRKPFKFGSMQFVTRVATIPMIDNLLKETVGDAE